jgi:hypothetical protein
MKQRKNETIKVYYERLLKLANSFQHISNYYLHIWITTIFIYSNSRHEKKNFATGQGSNFGL